MAERGPRLLIVDDERTVRNAYRALFEGHGYVVSSARSGDEALRKFGEVEFDLVLLDVMMPGRNGFSVCEEIRKRNPFVPLLFVTAMPGEVSLVRGLGLGADDYIDKSASEDELFARVRRAIERAAVRVAVRRTMMLDDVKVDFDALTARGGSVDVRLTRMEADILRVLNDARGEIVSYQALFDALKEYGLGGDLRMIRTHLSNLRRKLGRVGNLICNERNTGYRILL